MNELTQRFPTGMFQPNPKPATAANILAAQAKIEAKLFIRHGEQQLLSLFIPIVMLVGLHKLPLLEFDNSLERLLPMSLAIALMGAGFTGQAIAVAFDRRYGALKRIGASGVPTWALIGGKIVAVLVVASMQSLVLGVIAALLGWNVTLPGILAAIPTIIIGVCAFTALGLWLGGTLSSEMVLALANTIWFLLMGAVAYVTVRGTSAETAGAEAANAATAGTEAASAVTANSLTATTHPALDFIPSVAMVEGLADALNEHSIHWFGLGILALFGVIGAIGAMKMFKFTMDSD